LLVKKKVTPELIRLSALQFRGMKISMTRARALAPEIERLNNAALSAAQETDFNDEPTSLTRMLARLKSPGPRA
jgi:hypothetical protein